MEYAIDKDVASIGAVDLLRYDDGLAIRDHVRELLVGLHIEFRRERRWPLVLRQFVGHRQFDFRLPSGDAEIGHDIGTHWRAGDIGWHRNEKAVAQLPAQPDSLETVPLATGFGQEREIWTLCRHSVIRLDVNGPVANSELPFLHYGLPSTDRNDLQPLSIRMRADLRNLDHVNCVRAHSSAPIPVLVPSDRPPTADSVPEGSTNRTHL